MKVSDDCHIHTDASPCGDEQMTTQNIIQMARLLERQMIAITDHNTCCNCEVMMQVGKEAGILVVPGMEVECMEEFHLVALFPTLEKALQFESYVIANSLPIQNKPHIFGHQHQLSADDEVIGEIDRLLLSAVQQSVYDIYQKVNTLGGVVYPAHIDRNAYSILSNLGGIPEDIPFTCLEVSLKGNPATYEKKYPQYRLLQSSDAHYLETLCEGEQYLELDVLSMTHLFKLLANKIEEKR